MAAEAFTRRWRAVWRAAQREIEARGAWGPHLAPLLDEYVRALEAAERLFKAAEANPTHTSERTGRPFVNPAFAAADAESRRALAFARHLRLTAQTKPASSKSTAGPFSKLDAGDELGARRRRISDAHGER